MHEVLLVENVAEDELGAGSDVGDRDHIAALERSRISALSIDDDVEAGPGRPGPEVGDQIGG